MVQMLMIAFGGQHPCWDQLLHFEAQNGSLAGATDAVHALVQLGEVATYLGRGARGGLGWRTVSFDEDEELYAFPCADGSAAAAAVRRVRGGPGALSRILDARRGKHRAVSRGKRNSAWAAGSGGGGGFPQGEQRGRVGLLRRQQV
ncbi:unnamed protein product [Prorocentrum cordatum]|uniref:Uncharacterized protein n=1 Tax=Prorocentrum cordatum TaxID=2364126 RepID=A0ABN9UHR9_9DINO|nr:unnamed protein product [Polarella glacialis]